MPLINRLDSGSDDFADRLQALLSPPKEEAAIKTRVAEMLAQIEKDGDAALMELCEKFDNFRADTAAGFELSVGELKQVTKQVSRELWRDLETAADRLHEYHQQQLPESWHYHDEHGNRLGEVVTPVERAVIYAPGGTAAYPSSVLMGLIPAKIAGVSEVILTTPAPGGVIPPVTIAAAVVAECDRIFKLGGAQAIIGFALGTASVPAADVIVGPGNAYVAEAKRQVYGTVGIDSIAGPSEVLIISYGSAPAEWVAADLAAQAEHDSVAQSILISDDEEHIGAVIDALEALLPAL